MAQSYHDQINAALDAVGREAHAIAQIEHYIREIRTRLMHQVRNLQVPGPMIQALITNNNVLLARHEQALEEARLRWAHAKSGLHHLLQEEKEARAAAAAAGTLHLHR